MKTIMIFDLPTRLGHWLLAGGFTMAWLTGESEEFRYIHALSGGVVISVISHRLFLGLTDARQRMRFMRKPKATFGALVNLVILAILSLGLFSGITGWFVYQNQWGEWLEELHELSVHLMLLAVMIHLGGMIFRSIIHQQNLLRLMITGIKVIAVPIENTVSIQKEMSHFRKTRPLATLFLLIWVFMGTWWVSR